MTDYLRRFTDRINGVEVGVGKTQAPPATTDGFTGVDGTWNSMIKDPEGKKYRERVEILVFSGDTLYLAPVETFGDPYTIPGGSTEPGLTMEQQVINECKEEAHIIPKNIGYVGCYVRNAKSEMYEGAVSHLFVGEFDREYVGGVHDADKDSDMLKNGRFYPIDEVYDMLKSEHKRAVEKWRSGGIATEAVKYYSEMTTKERNALPDDEFGIPKRRAFPLNDANHVKSAITMFRHCPNSERKELAKRILEKYKKFNLDVKISKQNPLWKYAKDESGIVVEGVEFIPDGALRLTDYKQIMMSNENIWRYAPVFPKFEHMRFDPTDSGRIWLDGSVVVGAIVVRVISGEKWLMELVLDTDYTGKGLEEQMTKVAAQELGATRSKVNPEGDVSELVVDELGFEPSYPSFPVKRSYEESTLDDLLSKLDKTYSFTFEAPGDDEPTDYTRDVDDPADDDDNVEGEPADYTGDAETAADDDDDMEGDSTDYTADVDADDDTADNNPDAGGNEPEAQAEEAPAEDAQGEQAPAEADNADDEAAPQGDAEGGEDQPADDTGTDDDADMGEPTDYTDGGGADDEGNPDEGGDDAAAEGDQGGDQGGGEATEEQIDNSRQSLEIYRNIQNLYTAIEGYLSRLDSIQTSTANSSIVIQGVRSKFNDILDLMNDYMVTKFANDSLVEQTDTYTKFIVSTKMVIDLLKNNQAYLKQ